MMLVMMLSLVSLSLCFSFVLVFMLQKEFNDWVKKCMEHEVEGFRPRGRPKRTWIEVVQKNCQGYKLSRNDVMDHGRWRKLIKDD